MKEDNREIEVKFSILSVDGLADTIRETGAVCVQPVQFERNLRFDDKQGTLTENRKVLRLRSNGGASVLTWKSDSASTEELADREEIETGVEDFDRMKLILERLGYRTFFIYEKYRSIYSLRETGIFLDHTPIGDFVEIEGPDEEAIRETAEELGLCWDLRIGKGYRDLFKKWKEETGYTGSDMIFEKEQDED